MNRNDSRGLSVVLISLLKGVLKREDNEERWQMLMDAEPRARDYVRMLGLELVLVEDEGYAFLKQIETSPEDGEPEYVLPRLIARRPLSYPVSLLLALLRRKLAEHDASSGEIRLIVDVAEMVETVQTFLPEGNNEAKITDQIATHLRRIEDLGFIRFLKNDTDKFEVQRILKAFVTAQWLQEMEERMASVAGDKSEQVAEDAPGHGDPIGEDAPW